MNKMYLNLKNSNENISIRKNKEENIEIKREIQKKRKKHILTNKL